MLGGSETLPEMKNAFDGLISYRWATDEERTSELEDATTESPQTGSKEGKKTTLKKNHNKISKNNEAIM